MNSQQLLFINLIIFAVIVFFFFSGRNRRQKTTVLDMRKTDIQSQRITDIESVRAPPSVTVASVEVRSVPPAEARLREVGPAASVERVSEVGRRRFFVYNGHEWEAHEVLSVSRDASFVQITERYQQLIQISDPSTFEFYEAAYTALLSGRKK